MEQPVLSNINSSIGGGVDALFAFEADTPTTNLHANDPNPARFYAVNGDILGLVTDETLTFPAFSQITPNIWYIAAKPVQIKAGRDIGDAGAINSSGGSNAVGSLMMNNQPDDISLVEAGRDIVTSSFSIAGPGLLLVQAGRNLDQEDNSPLHSLACSSASMLRYATQAQASACLLASAPAAPIM